MNNSTISIYNGLVPSSIKALQDTMVANIGYIILGSLATLSNVLEFTTIAKDKKLKTRCYFLIANISIASIIYGVSYVAVGIKRLIRLYFMIPEVNTKRMCAAEMFTCSFGQTATVFLPLATAVDRICAAIMPIKYKNMSSQFAIFSASMTWIMALVDSSFSFFGSDQNNLIANCNLVSATELLYQVQSTVEMIVSVLVTICYFSVILLLQKQLSDAKIKSENLAAAKTKIQIKVAKTLGIDSSIHLITQVATRVGLAVLTPMSPEIRFLYAPFIRLIIIVGSGASLVVFLAINKEFQMAFRRTFICCFKPIVPASYGSFWVMRNTNADINALPAVSAVDKEKAQCLISQM